MAHENFLINPASNPPKRLRRRIKKGWSVSPRLVAAIDKVVRLEKKKKINRKRNPIGELLVTVGANPSRRNPMRKLKRKVKWRVGAQKYGTIRYGQMMKAKTRFKSNPENPWFGDPNGHRIAALMRWGKLPKGRVKRYRKRGRPVVHGFGVAKKQRKYVIKKRRRMGSSLGLMRMHTERASGRVRSRAMFPHLAFASGRPGGREFSHNPLVGRSFMRKYKRSRKQNTWFGAPRRHRKAAKKGWRRGHLLKAKGSKRRHRVRHRNPMVGTTMSNPIHYRRRRNPALGGMLKQFTGGVMDVRGWAPLAVTGAFSAITGATVPAMIGVVNPWAKLGVQTAIAIGGGIAVEKFVDKRHGQAWMIVGVAMVGYQLLKQFVLVPYLPQFAVGLGDYPSYYPVSQYENEDEVSQQVGAFPNQVGAFVNDYPGVGGEMGAYPYDGAGY